MDEAGDLLKFELGTTQTERNHGEQMRRTQTVPIRTKDTIRTQIGPCEEELDLEETREAWVSPALSPVM